MRVPTTKLCDMSHLMEMSWTETQEIMHLIESSKSTVINSSCGHEMNRRISNFPFISLEAICRYAMDPANGVWIVNE